MKAPKGTGPVTPDVSGRPMLGDIVVPSKSKFMPEGVDSVTLESDQFPWNSPEFLRGLVMYAGKSALYRRAILDTAGFVEAMIKEGTDDSQESRDALEYLGKVESGKITWEEIEGSIKSRYAWTLESRDFAGLRAHFVRKNKPGL